MSVSAKLKYCEKHGEVYVTACRECVREKELATLRAEVATLRAENERLRTVLSKYARGWDGGLNAEEALEGK